MFDLITGKTRHIPSTPGLPVLISMTAQVTVVTALLVPALFFTGALPDVPTMMAFVAEAAPPPPPPPPAARTSAPPRTQPVPAPGAAPVEPPSTIQPERPLETGEIGGVPGGVEGGIPGGVPGGIVGGLLSDIPPPPPPPAPAPKAPVRVGGDIKPPTLTHRVEPIYPAAAVHARLHGVVILEAIVNREGRVIEVTVLRSAG